MAAKVHPRDNRLNGLPYRSYRHGVAQQLATRLNDLEYGPMRMDNPDYSKLGDQTIPKKIPNHVHRAGVELLYQYIRASHEGQDWLAPQIARFVDDPQKQLAIWAKQSQS